MARKYDVRIDGQGYLLAPKSYSREMAGPSPGLKEWAQRDWRGGDGWRLGRGDGGPGKPGEPGNRWRAGLGVEIEVAGKLSLGAAVSTSYASTENGLALCPFGPGLYAAATSSGKVYQYTGGWVEDHDTGKASLRCLAVWGEKLYVGSGSDGLVKGRDTAGVWADLVTIAGASGIPVLGGYDVWDAGASRTAPRLWIGVEYPSGQARVYVWDGVAAGESFACQEPKVEAMAVYGGQLYVATSDRIGSIYGRLLVYDGRRDAGEWREAARLADDYIAGMAVFDGLLFCGGGYAGKVYAFDGESLVEACDFKARGVASPGSLRGLAVLGGRLYVGYNHGTDGAALAGKLAAWQVREADLEVVAGARPQLERAGAGWYMPSGSGAAGSVRSLAPYKGSLYFSRDAVGAATVYRRMTSSYRPSGSADLGEFDGGVAEACGCNLLPRRVVVTHDRLVAGESVAVSFSLEGSDIFHHEEAFGDLSGCDLAETTADWRPAAGQVRLKGMPRQDFSGKVAGSTLAVAHLARKSASQNGALPPGAYGAAAEFGQAEYDAVVAADGSAAVTSTLVPGWYASQLFEWDVLGLNLAGLKPKAVVYGIGDHDGVATNGVLLRIWNQQTATWDLVGQNAAAAGAPEVEKTIVLEIADWSRYVASGRVYLSPRALYPGTGANASEVGTDLVSLEAMWAASGEAVAMAVRRPDGGLVANAMLTLVAAAAPAGGAIDLFMSADGGIHWEACTSGVALAFANPGAALRWKAILTGDGAATPTISHLKLEYGVGSWIPLGTSDVVGATARVFEFPAGLEARRLGLRLALASGDAARGPAVTGITLEYSELAAARRRWQFDARCEGAPGLPLKLLDGSLEAASGAELSCRLWSARERGVVAFEDLDGRSYTVWFEELAESPGNLPQDRGAQMVARCRLVEW